MDKSLKILLVAGARPNFIKIAPIIDAIRNYNNKLLKYTLVHTGQHYDELMSKLFFEDLEIPKPDINLEVGSASHAEQTAEIMKRFEPLLKKELPDVVIVVGDVNSTLACSLVASKIVYPITQSINQSNQRRRPLVAHVEAGLRSFDRTMPEEINRVLTDSIADVLFTTEDSAYRNLKREGIPDEKIFFVGNVMIDTLLKHKQKAQKSDIIYRLGLMKHSSTDNSQLTTDYCVLTLHRPSNVDDKRAFKGILEALLVIANELPIIFPIHPRTLNRIHKFGFDNYFDFSRHDPRSANRNKRIHCVDPLGYLDFLHLMANSKLVLTDSGGIQEETTILEVPCVTLRENTERPVTVTDGTNVIAGTKKENIIKSAISHLNKPLPREMRLFNRSNKNIKPKFWDGRAAERIVNILANSIL